MNTRNLKTVGMGRRFAAVLAIGIAATIGLVACGGGGGGATTVVPPATVTITCWNRTTAATASACPVVTAPTVALSSASDPVITFATGAASTGGTLTATVGAITLIYGIQPSGATIQGSGLKSYATTYTYSATLNYSNGPSQTVTGTYTTGASPATSAAYGVKLFNPMKPPFESDTTNNPGIGGATWVTADTSGLIQTFETGMIITGIVGISPFALQGKFFIEPVGNAVCAALVYKNTGLNVNANPVAYTDCLSVPFDWVVGTAEGFVMHYPSTGLCERKRWVLISVSDYPYPCP